MKRPIRVAGVYGALGDDFTALGRAVRGEPVDAIIGDYLAEITMGVVAANFVGPQFAGKLQGYYCASFLQQIEPELPEIARRGIRVIVNAGAFAPRALAEEVRKLVRKAGLSLQVAAVDGDDMLAQLGPLCEADGIAHLEGRTPMPVAPSKMLAANAYLGGWGIAAALAAGSDIVVCGRVTDASLTVGAAAWWHHWARDDWDALAGAVVAGHVIECGSQALGGNFSGFRDHPTPARLGFPIAEVAGDGTCVITKPAAEQGHVTCDTVTAQMLYEIQGTRYLNPDVVLHMDSPRLTQLGDDRVEIAGTRGSPPPATTKLSCYWHNGYRQVFHSYVSGRSVPEKLEWLRAQLDPVAANLSLDSYSFEPLGTVPENPASLPAATMAVRIAAAAAEEEALQKLLAAYFAVNLGGFPGIHGDYAPVQPRIDYWPGLVRQDRVPHRVTLDDGSEIAIAAPSVEGASPSFTGECYDAADASPDAPDGPTVAMPLGAVAHARSGDKGANANLGVWSRSPDGWPWLRAALTPDRVATLLALPEGVAVHRYDLPNVNALLFVLVDYFGRSGTGNVALDQIGKSIGEFLLARVIEVPQAIATDLRTAP